MLIIAFLWVLLSISFLGWGKMFSSFFGHNAVKQDFSETGYFFMGLSFVGLIVSLIWPFFSISIVVGSILLGIGLGYSFASWPIPIEINFNNRWFLAASVLFGFAILMKAAAPTTFYDCGLYYVQTIKWAQAFPVVPGLANLHIRFGNVSSWHILGAAFDWPSVWKGNFDDLGELVLLWFVIFHGWNALKMNGFERYVSIGLVIFSIIQSQPLLTAPSPDLACGLLGMQTLWQFRKFLRTWNPRQPNQLNTRGIALFVQSLFLAQIKLSAFPFFIISILILFLILREGWYKMGLVLSSLGLIVLAGIVWRSFVLSGYLVFPVLDGNLAPDWKVLPQEVSSYLNGVRGFARHILSSEELNAGKTYEDLGKLKFIDWFPLWVKDRRWNEWVIIAFAISGWLLLVRFASSHVRKSFRGHWPLIFFTWLSGMMLLFWFSNAPDVRFGMAILGIGFSFTFGTITEQIRNRWSDWNSQLYVETCLIVISSFSVWYFLDLRSLKENPLFPPKYLSITTKEYMLEDGSKVYTPEPGKSLIISKDQCWGSQLPCAPNEVGGLKRRAETLEAGFSRRNMK